MSKDIIDENFKAAFLEMLTQIPNLTKCCRTMGISTTAIDKARKRDEEFDQGVKEKLEEGYDLLEWEARRRAVNGIEEPVFFKGEVCGKVTKYSDKLLEVLLRGRRPKVFNPGLKLEGDNGAKITMTFNMESDEE